MLIKVINSDNYLLDDNIDEYVKDRTIEAICGCTGENVYEDYLEYCKANNIENILSNFQFRKRLTLTYDLTTIVKNINGKSKRIIIKK